MGEERHSLVTGNVHAVKFESNKEFQTKGVLYDGDSGFLRFRHKVMHPKGDTQANREIVTTLLSTQGDNSTDYVEKLLAEDISYRDLASLTHQDLELMGFSKRKQRDELLAFFAQLPNQDPSYDQICHIKEAHNYNRKIIHSANQHLESMRSALAAANYKLQISPPVDVIVGEKSFASRFVLDALKELYDVTDDIDKEIIDLEKKITNKLQTSPKKSASNKRSKENRRSSYFHPILLLGTTASLVVVMALYCWKLQK